MKDFPRRWSLPAVIGLVAFLAACQPQAQQPAAAPDTRAADEAAIRNLDTQWSKAASEANVEQFVSFFADGASFLPPNQPTITTKEDIQKWATGLMTAPGFKVSWEPAKAVASRGGDLGYTVGTYELTMNNPKGKPVTDHGKYLTVWTKQADGSWKVAADTFNSDLPPEGASGH